MCIEAWLDGCVERLLGIPVVKVPIFLVRWSYLLCDGSWKNFLPLFCLMFSLYSIECISPLLSVVSLFFYQLFLFSFHWILLFSCRRRLCALSFYRPLLIPCAHLGASTTWNSRLRTCFLRPICTFCTLNPWFYCWGVDLFVVSGRWREKYPFPSPLIQWITTFCCIPVKGEGEKRKTAGRAYARAKGSERTVRFIRHVEWWPSTWKKTSTSTESWRGRVTCRCATVRMSSTGNTGQGLAIPWIWTNLFHWPTTSKSNSERYGCSPINKQPKMSCLIGWNRRRRAKCHSWWKWPSRSWRTEPEFLRGKTALYRPGK